MTVALADYVPPSESSSPTSPTAGTGRRGGCAGDAETELTALAPHRYVGQTVSTRPTFAWFVPDSQPLSMEFRLDEYGPSGKRRIIEQPLTSSPGIMKLSIPQNQSGLSVGQKYRWQVIILCNPNRPSGSLVAEAEIEVVEMPPVLKTALSGINNYLERASLYARAGLWYDALGEVLKATEDLRTKEYKLTLLEDLARSEEPGGEEKGREQSVRLRQIIKVERQQNSSRLP